MNNYKKIMYFCSNLFLAIYRKILKPPCVLKNDFLSTNLTMKAVNLIGLAA